MDKMDAHSHGLVETVFPGCTANRGSKTIIEKWFLALDFPKQFHREFYQALEAINIPDTITLEHCDMDCPDGKRNLLTFLFLCEQLEVQYAEKGIPHQILMDTLQDIVTYTRLWSEVKGTLYLGELNWLSRHLQMRLFRLGRLQFCMAVQEDGANVLEIHIPESGPLLLEACDQSFAAARDFFARYYPDFAYQCFTCHSWLLDSTLLDYLPDSSNILKFRKRFRIGHEEESDILLRYLFRWDTTSQNVHNAVCSSGFSERIKKAVLSGVKFHETMGILL